ncbi:outer membrane protein [Candidatus Symbiothrix dinenymphae]|nr:outer membrane protein [Candidatus Symbiothrix dinenymphae]
MNHRIFRIVLAVFAGIGAAAAQSQTQPQSQLQPVQPDTLPIVRHELSIHVGGGFSSLLSMPKAGKNKLAGGFDFGVGYTYFFTKKWAVSGGVGAAFFNGKYALSQFADSYEQINNLPVNDGTLDLFDGVSEFTYSYTAYNYTEKQYLALLTIPLLLHFETKATEKDKFYAALGVKVGLPLSAIKYRNNVGTLHASGEIPDGSIFSGPDYMGFGDFSDRGSKGRIKQPKTAFFVSAEAGMKWALNDEWSLYTGAYLDYGINKIVEPDKEHFIEYNADYFGNDANLHPSGLLVETPKGEAFVGKEAPVSVGVRVALAFGKKPPRAATILPPPVEPPVSPKPSVDKATKERLRVERLTDVRRLQEPINFEFDRSDLLLASRTALDKEIIYLKRQLDEKIRVLKKYPDLQVRIEGHTDNIGTAEYNVILGKDRAEVVKAYMLEKGIPAKIIVEVVSKGASVPLVPNTGEENRRKNRRVVIVVAN